MKYKYVDFSPFLDNDGNWKGPKNATISTAEQLAGLMVIVNADANTTIKDNKDRQITIKSTRISFSGCTIKLTEKIDLSVHEWVPIGKDKSHHFSASLDGSATKDGICKIQGMKIGSESSSRDYSYAGLIGYAKGENITISNVGIDKNSEIYAMSSSDAGGLVGFISADVNNEVSLENCYNTGTISSNCAGGLVGFVSGNAYTNLSLKNCYNAGTISGRYYAGGLVGLIYYGVRLENCYNTGTISSGQGCYGVGGLVGFAESCIFENCYNTGTISGENNAGGLVGYAWLNAEVRLENCYNTGTISGGQGCCGVGGLVGYAWPNAKVKLENCYYLGATQGVGNKADEESGAINLLKDAQTESVELRPNEIKTIPNTEANVELRANSELQKLGKGFKMVYIYETPKDITISSEANEDNKLSISMIEGAKSGVAKLKGIKITQNALTKNGYTGNVFEFEKNLTCEKSFDINVLALN